MGNYEIGGKVSKEYLTKEVPYDEYPSIFGDWDNDATPDEKGQQWRMAKNPMTIKATQTILLTTYIHIYHSMRMKCVDEIYFV